MTGAASTSLLGFVLAGYLVSSGIALRISFAD